MGKGYKAKVCTYCGVAGASQAGDHVFARKLFPVEHRANLPQVPACGQCNQAKAQLEHYLLTLLPFGGRHPNSSDLLHATAPPRLARNLKLHQELAAGRGRAWLDEKGIVRPATTLPFDGDKLLTLFRYVVRGLIAYHWQVQVPQSYAVGASVLTRHGASFVEPFFRGQGGARVQVTLGDGLVEYEGVQAADDPALSLWRFRLYGGVRLADDPQRTSEAVDMIWGMSAKNLFSGI
jgi:hypothetical protein